MPDEDRRETVPENRVLVWSVIVFEAVMIGLLVFDELHKHGRL